MIDRREFMRLGAGAAGALALAPDRLADLQTAMASGRMTARSVTQQYIDRINELDRRVGGSRLHN